MTNNKEWLVVSRSLFLLNLIKGVNYANCKINIVYPGVNNIYGLPIIYWPMDILQSK